MTIPKELQARMDEILAHYPVSKRSASLPFLHLWQERHGFISDEAISWIAAKLELQPINILELVTFYPMFRRHPVGKRHIRVCRNVVLRHGRQLRGARCDRPCRGDRYPPMGSPVPRACPR
jgi:NADH-quinone oxidoreductase subunit E